MVVGITLFVMAVLIIAIWVVIEIKRLKHKLFAIFLIALILFTYVSFTVTLRGQEIDYATIPGMLTATKLYVSWLGSIFGNMKAMTIYAIRMDWKGNNTNIGEKFQFLE